MRAAHPRTLERADYSASSRSCQTKLGADTKQKSRLHAGFLLCLMAMLRYCSDRIHSTSVLTSASGTLLGGIGIAPHTPLPPAFTFPISFSSALLSSLYFLATS